MKIEIKRAKNKTFGDIPVGTFFIIDDKAFRPDNRIYFKTSPTQVIVIKDDITYHTPIIWDTDILYTCKEVIIESIVVREV